MRHYLTTIAAAALSLAATAQSLTIFKTTGERIGFNSDRIEKIEFSDASIGETSEFKVINFYGKVENVTPAEGIVDLDASPLGVGRITITLNGIYEVNHDSSEEIVLANSKEILFSRRPDAEGMNIYHNPQTGKTELSYVFNRSGLTEVGNYHLYIPKGAYVDGDGNQLSGSSRVFIIPQQPKFIYPVDAAGKELTHHKSYNMSHYSISFQIDPISLLHDFTPAYKIEGEGLLPFSATPMIVDHDKGQVCVHFSSARKAGMGQISVSLSSGPRVMTGHCQVRMDAPIEGASFYGPAYAGHFNSEFRPPLHTDKNWYERYYNQNMDVSSYDTCRVAVNILTGLEADAKEAYKSCSWICVEGSSVQAVETYNELVPGHGFDAVLVVASGVNRGKTVFKFCYPGDTLTATYNVLNLKEDFPVDRITTDAEEINLSTGQSFLLTPGVIPASSYTYHRPKVVAADPAIVSVSDYVRGQVAIKGLKPGKTTLVLSANDKTKTINVTVVEGVRSVIWADTPAKVFVGETIDWTVNVLTPSGAPSPFPVEWYADDEAIATAVAKPGSETTTGLVKGISSGVTTIYAKVLDQRSDSKAIAVLPLPDGDMTLTNNGTFEMYGDGSQLVINIDQKGKGALYEYVTIYLNDAFKGSLAGNFKAGNGSYMELDGRRVAIASADITSTGKDGKFTLNGSVTFAVTGVGNFTFKFKNLQVEGYE